MPDHAYLVTVRRTATSTKEFRVVAPNKALATPRGLALASNVVFTEQDAEYTVDSVRRED